MGEVIVDEVNGVAYIQHLRAAVTISKSKVDIPVEKPQLVESEIAKWGDSNIFPQDTIESAYATTIIPTVLEWKAKALYSEGLVYGEAELDETTGKETLKRKYDPKVEEFLRRSNIKRYLIESCQDFYWWINLWPEINLSMDRSQVVSLSVQDASYCRWGKQNEKSGIIENAYVNANWGNGANLGNSIKIPALNPYFDTVEQAKNGKAFKYIYPVNYPTPGRTYYQKAAWTSLIDSGWIDVLKSIPKFKKSLMTNQLLIKYHIEINMNYWKSKFPDWDSYDAKKKKDAYTNELSNFNSLMQGEEKAGNSIMTQFETGPNGEKIPMWVVTAIDDKVKSGLYIEDSQEASSHAFMALGVDPTLVGISPGKGMGAGSGSDKRVAFNIYMSNCKTDMDLILEPLEFVRDFNGWNPKLKFWFKNYFIATLDSGAQVQSKPNG